MINEFYCDQCNSYSLVNMQEDIDGLHIIKCVKCKHLHYRIIEKGNITDCRYNDEALNDIKINRIYYEGVLMSKQTETVSLTSGSWLQTMGVI